MEARRACYEKLVSFRIEQGQDPDDYNIKLTEIHRRLELIEKVYGQDV